jgi:hypothetical protein
VSNENILSVNVANGISILIMGAVLALGLAWFRAYATKTPAKFGNAPQAALATFA